MPLHETKNDLDQGYVLVTTLIFISTAALIAGSYLVLSANDARVSRMAIDQQKAAIAAEAGLDYGMIKLKELLNSYQLSPSVAPSALQAQIDSIPAPDPAGEYAYQTPQGLSAFKISVESPLQSGVITNGTVAQGLNGQLQLFSVTCGAINQNSGMSAVRKQLVQGFGLYLIRYAVFYEDDLELHPGSNMDIFGRIHCNSDAYLGGDLRIRDAMTTVGRIYHQRKNDASRNGEAKIDDDVPALVSMKQGSDWIDSNYGNWMIEALTRWDGNVLSDVHGTKELNPPINPSSNPHEIIEQALSTNDPAYFPDTEAEKFANKAALVLRVDSNGVFSATDFFTNNVTPSFTNAALSISGVDGDGDPIYAKDAQKEYLMVTNGVFDVKQTDFHDHREFSQMAPIDIYVDELLSSFPEIYDGTYANDEGKGIVYVTREDPDGSGAGVMPCVRIRNGRDIVAPDGLTIASDLPVYVEGDYNVVATKPALVAGDAVTFLSKNWQDAPSDDYNKNTRTPVNTEYNTVVMTGNTETLWGQYNGGVENAMRLLEDWSGVTVTYRGSIVVLWYSEIADSVWDWADYYDSAIRNWGYDPIYATQNPPGMTLLVGMEEVVWARTTWVDEGW